jgi:CheY-like chemotaxis protein
MGALRILLVDDERQISRMLRATLELSAREYVVVEVPSGEEAILELGRGPVDLLISDVRLPGMSGLDLIERARQLSPGIRSVVITGHPAADLHSRAEALGVAAVLEKPVKTGRFLEAVDRALDQVPADGQLQAGGLAGDTPLISDHLTTMRRDLGAEAVYLLDELGRIVVRAGELDQVHLEAVLPSLMASFGAGRTASHLLGAMLPGFIHYFEGEIYNLYLTNVGGYYALLMGFPAHQEIGQLGSVVLYGRRAASDLLAELSRVGAGEPAGRRSGVAVLEEEPQEQFVGEEAPPVDLDQLDEDEKQADPEAFWESAVSETPNLKQAEGDALTYDQARKLGLLPDDLGDEAG